MRFLYTIADTPNEGELFEVKPFEIDKTTFETPRENARQEKIRGLIQEAFAECDRCPEKYAQTFYTLIPVKECKGCKSIAEIKAYAKNLGGQMTDWVEQALEWAQRICNGETWESVCNYPDTANWYRLIVWKNGKVQIVGGAVEDWCGSPPSSIGYFDLEDSDTVSTAVPSITFKKTWFQY